MERKCPNCGAVVAPNATRCSTCGAAIPVASPLQSNIYAIAGAVLALILMLLCLITNFADSSTFINRMYTTAIAWNIPLATIALIVVGFVVSHREKQPLLINIVSIACLALGFLFSNITKNTIQDHISNLDNYVDVAAEGMKDNAEDVIDWKDDIEDAAKDVEHELERDYERKYDRY